MSEIAYLLLLLIKSKINLKHMVDIFKMLWNTTKLNTFLNVARQPLEN